LKKVGLKGQEIWRNGNKKCEITEEIKEEKKEEWEESKEEIEEDEEEEGTFEETQKKPCKAVM